MRMDKFSWSLDNLKKKKMLKNKKNRDTRYFSTIIMNILVQLLNLILKLLRLLIFAWSGIY